jgi:ABC-type nitrate/sulfonate/bicarbonate transport system substrate-binding protein
MRRSGKADANLMPLGRALEVGSLDDSFVAIPAPVGKWLFGLIAHEELGAADLRGGKVGVAQIGDSTYNYAVALLDRLGLTPGDVEWIVTGAEGRMPALVARRVDATMLSAPAYFRLEEHGFRDLANIIDYDDLHTPSVLLVRKEALLERPQLADALVKAHAEAVERFYADKEFAIAAHRVYDRQEIGDLGRVYDRYRERNLLERVPHIGEDAIRYVVETVPDTAVLSRLRAFDAASLIDNETLDRLVNSGFFDSLFGPEVLAR